MAARSGQFYQLKNPYTLDYFKSWGNGKALTDEVKKKLKFEKGDFRPEKKKKGLPVYVEGFAKVDDINYVVLSDADFDYQSFSNKHHYIIEKEFFDKQFEKAKISSDEKIIQEILKKS